MANKTLAAVLAALLMFSCSSQHKPTPEEMAGRTAKLYYDYLLEGKYEAYVDGLYQPDRIPESYRQQLITNAKMFVGEQKEEHRGIDSVKVVTAKADTVKRIGEAYLSICFGDSTREEIVVPMVYHNGVWMMR